MTANIKNMATSFDVVQFVRDVFALMKPRIILLLVITCMGGYLVASKGMLELMSLQTAIITALGLALSAGGANTINMWYDRDIDVVMSRTQKRPLPQGRMKPNTVLFLGIFWGIVSHTLLWFMVNPLTSLMALCGYLFYVFVYTMFLKRRTVQNIVIGGAAGAFPPLVGWAAVQNNLNDIVPWAMFAIIFLWTPPHFWALALKKCSDYTKAHVPMLPVVKGEHETKVQIVYYMLVLIPVTLVIAMAYPFGWIYFICAAVLGAVWLYKAVKLMYEDGIGRSMDVFWFSLHYLALIFAAMVLDTFV